MLFVAVRQQHGLDKPRASGTKRPARVTNCEFFRAVRIANSLHSGKSPIESINAGRFAPLAGRFVPVILLWHVNDKGRE